MNVLIVISSLSEKSIMDSRWISPAVEMTTGINHFSLLTIHYFELNIPDSNPSSAGRLGCKALATASSSQRSFSG